MTRYGFRQALGAFFLADSAALRPLLPAGLPLLEARPGHGVLAVTAFDFVESEVGAYGELVLSALVPPFAGRDEEFPRAATFPFALFTTTPASRGHAAERWLLPAHPACLDIAFHAEGDLRRVTAAEDGRPVLDLEVRRRPAPRRSTLYQCLSARDGTIYRVNLEIEGELDEHEEESGRLVLHDHPLTAAARAALAEEAPLREQSMGPGEQRFAALVPLGVRR